MNSERWCRLTLCSLEVAVVACRLLYSTWNETFTLCCTSVSRPKGASGTADEDFVLLSLRTSLSLAPPEILADPPRPGHAPE